MTEQPKNNGVIMGKDPKTGQFLPGHHLSTGKPKGTRHIGPLLKAKLKEMVKDKDRTYTDLLIERILNEAIIKGDYQFVNLLMNHVDGPATLGLDITSDGEQIGTMGEADIERMAAEISKKIKKEDTDIVD